MKKVAVVYWSGTGNTEAMAGAVIDGIKDAGASADLYFASDFKPEMLDRYDAVGFGCPSMGAEELEESEFAPMFEKCEGRLQGKSIALFGSYGWGDGEWMRTWEKRCREIGAQIVSPSVICNEAPNEEALGECRALGKSLLK